MICLKKEIFPKKKCTKLIMNKTGPFKILEKCGNNASKFYFLIDVGFFANFNISNIYEYKHPISNAFSIGSQILEKMDMKKDLLQQPKSEINAYCTCRNDIK